jgi:DNA-binding GntR family transcriptional regulator
MSVIPLRQRGADRPNISEQAYQHLRSLIIGQQLPPGSIVTERRLAEALSASRTPLRAAISRLEGEGLVERLTTGAVVIRQISIDELMEILSVRRLLEGEAAALAASRVDPNSLKPLIATSRDFCVDQNPDFEAYWRYDDAVHDLIATECGKPLLASLIDGLRQKARMCHLHRMPRSFDAQAREHLAILEALQNREARQAKRAMERHLDQVRSRLLDWLSKS